MKIKNIYIDKKFTEESETFNKGIYFETGCIGAGRDGKQLLELPKNKDGSDKAETIRINDQINKFKNEVMPMLQIDIMYTQKELIAPYDEETLLTGVGDIIGKILDPTINDKNKILAIIDLKLTGNIFTQYGDFCWAFPYNMDHSQAYMYKKLAKHMSKGKDFEFYYFIFDYKPKPEFKIIRKTMNGLEEKEFEESIRKTKEKIKYYNGMGWEPNPSYKECKSCPLKENCPASGKVSQFIEVV